MFLLGVPVCKQEALRKGVAEDLDYELCAGVSNLRSPVIQSIASDEPASSREKQYKFKILVVVIWFHCTCQLYSGSLSNIHSDPGGVQKAC